MAKFLFEHFPDREKHVLFQNTGREDEKTLEFILECDRRWDLRVVWLEAVVHHDERKASSHKIVDFESASRNGEPFEEVIKKYGIPFMFASHCTREMKIRVGWSYLRSIGLKPKDCETAIGIRADESHRINRERAAKEHTIYPLADMITVNKAFIKNWWANQEFDLQILPYVGNCDFCFKKSISSLVSLTREQPERLDWWERMENKYGHINAKRGDPYVFYRGRRSAGDLRELAKQPTLFDAPEFQEETDCFCKSA